MNPFRSSTPRNSNDNNASSRGGGVVDVSELRRSYNRRFMGRGLGFNYQNDLDLRAEEQYDDDDADHDNGDDGPFEAEDIESLRIAEASLRAVNTATRSSPHLNIFSFSAQASSSQPINIPQSQAPPVLRVRNSHPHDYDDNDNSNNNNNTDIDDDARTLSDAQTLTDTNSVQNFLQQITFPPHNPPTLSASTSNETTLPTITTPAAPPPPLPSVPAPAPTPFPSTSRFQYSIDADGQLMELLAMNESLQMQVNDLNCQVGTLQSENYMLREHQADNTEQILREATSEQNTEYTKLCQERSQLAKETRDLTILLEEISGGLETQEGFKRRKETELDKLSAEETLRKPKMDFVHIAVAGARGTGRASFVNAMRGMSGPRDGKEFAPVGGVGGGYHFIKKEYDDELESKGKGRQGEAGANESGQPRGYRDCRSGMDHIIWYELSAPIGPPVLPWDYFNSEGMFAFDAIILLVSESAYLEDTDIAILQQARYRKNPIPVFLVKMKTDIGIQNVLNDSDCATGLQPDRKKPRGQWEGDDIDDESYDEGMDVPELGMEDFLVQKWLEAKETYSERIKTLIATSLSRYRGLDPEKRVYLVSKKSLADVSRLRITPLPPMYPTQPASPGWAEVSLGETTMAAARLRLVDEEDLWKDIMRTVYRVWKTRCQQQGKPAPHPLPQHNISMRPAMRIPYKRDVVVLSSPPSAPPTAPLPPIPTSQAKSPVKSQGANVTVKQEKPLKRRRSNDSSMGETDEFEVVDMDDF